MQERTKAVDGPSYAAPALGKGLDILELLAERDQPISMKAIAEELRRSKSEIFRMVMVLIERGYIARDRQTDTFTLTNKLFDLGLKTPRAKDLLTVAVPIMRRLADECGHSPHLVVIHHGETAVLAAVPGGLDMSFTLKLGYHRVAVDATSGQVIMAFQPPEIRARLIADSARLLQSPVNQKELRTELDRIRAQGYEMHPSRDFVGITDICCPVLERSGHAVASIIIAYVNRLGKESRHREVLASLKKACEAIGAAIS